MMVSFLDNLQDKRSNCYSIMAHMTVADYLDLVKPAYEQQGSIDGQRDKLKSTSGVRIRTRMVNDFKQNAILPPVVLGVVVNEEKLTEVNKISDDKALASLISELPKETMSIIDGMQRTTVFLETKETTKNSLIRVEFWVTDRTDSLTYRMLVLNTGQVPWNLRRQVEVVYAPLHKEIESQIASKHSELAGKYKFYNIDDGGSRTKAGEYHRNHLIELYLSCALRREKIDTSSILAQDFSRLDMIEAMANESFLSEFVSILVLLIKLDHAFSEKVPKPEIADLKISYGRQVFDSMPAKVGFIVAASQVIYGRAGSFRTDDQQKDALVQVQQRVNTLVGNISKIKAEDVEQFFAFSILSERIENAPTNRIGDWQRAFYLEAFRLLLTDSSVETLEPCWRAY